MTTTAPTPSFHRRSFRACLTCPIATPLTYRHGSRPTRDAPDLSRRPSPHSRRPCHRDGPRPTATSLPHRHGPAPAPAPAARPSDTAQRQRHGPAPAPAARPSGTAQCQRQRHGPAARPSASASASGTAQRQRRGLERRYCPQLSGWPCPVGRASRRSVIGRRAGPIRAARTRPAGACASVPAAGR